MWPKQDELIPQTESILGAYRSKPGLLLWANCWPSLCVQSMQEEVQENPTVDDWLCGAYRVPTILNRGYSEEGMNTQKPDQWETLLCRTWSRPCHKSVLEAQSEQLLMSITRQDKSLPFTLIFLCHPYYKLPLSFSYLKTPKQAYHTLLLLALQSHHRDRY